MTQAHEPGVDEGDPVAVAAIAGLVATGMPGPFLQDVANSIASGLEISDASVAELLSRDGARVLVLYQPPWEAFLEAASRQRFPDGEQAPFYSC